MTVDSHVHALSQSAQGFVPLIATIAALYVGWRLWAFTISPALHPDAPKPLPYKFPFFGHVVGMSKCVGEVLTRGREHFGNTREIFGLTVMGQDMYIATSPKDVLSIYKETKKLDMNPVIAKIMRDFDCTKENVQKMFDTTNKPKSWMDTCHDDFKLQMHPGERLEILQTTVLNNIDRLLQWDQVVGVKSTKGPAKIVSAWEWCRHALVDGATRAFFGDAIYRVAPDILSVFYIYDDDAWKQHYNYPKFAARNMYEAKEQCLQAWIAYLSLPVEEREDASWIVKKIEQGLKQMGVDEPSQAAPNLLSLHRLVNTNAYRLCFWSLAYILHDPETIKSIKTEIQPAFKNKILDMPYLLDHCPSLASFYEEILRYVNDPVGIREVTEQVSIGGKTLQPGRTLLMPYRQLHFDTSVFGPNAATFDPHRFLENKSLIRSTSWRPFGGAATHCPGRFLARREVYMFVATVLFRYDIRLAPGLDGTTPKFPRLDETIPSGGILSPVAGDDLLVQIQRINL
ncbi:hypothetical protein KVR01_007462 [Diaporthe batatas]|uniref:uncharacterized protein n=1 Tax=Diaporthe batatas TaxID=748121 RepID=UPI001D03919D|nr:uncharacterized protein KVR01_007462 [Diaporthe batatas]KAG8162984.1 hypothetical protein KVR01_007462 [Diaporthe batatas]